METKQLEAMRSFRHAIRLGALVWVLVGGAFVAFSLSLLVKPSAIITYNGIATTAFGPKLFAVLFAGVFLFVGLGIMFSPARFLDRVFVWRQSVLASLFSWRR
jgi:uncharacterized membrane-anchored protein YitT (DUF2179 family)